MLTCVNMHSEEVVATASIVYTIIKRRKNKVKRKKREMWCKPWLLRRAELWVFDTLLFVCLA